MLFGRGRRGGGKKNPGECRMAGEAFVEQVMRIEECLVADQFGIFEQRLFQLRLLLKYIPERREFAERQRRVGLLQQRAVDEISRVDLKTGVHVGICPEKVCQFRIFLEVRLVGHEVGIAANPRLEQRVVIEKPVEFP